MIKKSFRLLAIILIVTYAAIQPTSAQNICDQQKQNCLADCQSFGNPLVTFCGCSGGFEGIGQTCNWCCQNKWNQCYYCNTYGNQAGDPRCNGCGY